MKPYPLSDRPKRFDPRAPIWGNVCYAVLATFAIGMVFYLNFAS
jgi:hypothetical protein